MSEAAGRQLYVYYRVPEAEVPAVARAVHAAGGAATLDHPRLVLDLLRRPGSKDGEVTLMEIHRADPSGVDAALHRCVDAHLQHQLIEALGAERAAALWQGRHVEVFVPCASLP